MTTSDKNNKTIITGQVLSSRWPVSAIEIDTVSKKYPFKIPPHMADLMSSPGDPIWLQAVPDISELDDGGLIPDPLCESPQSPVSGLIHRYPDRVVFCVSNTCAMYCRHCMRKRRVGHTNLVSPDLIESGISYIREAPEISDVILSGGDPLMLPDDTLIKIVSDVHAIDHVEMIRIHTRVPGVMPERVTGELASKLSAFHPLFMNIQFNHPSELTEEARDACAMLADAGIQLGSQTVLLAGVNDDVSVLESLFKGLLKMRIRPYYLHHPDVISGTRHFRVSVEKGLGIMKGLQGRISGMAIPHYMIDLPGGGGKVPLVPDRIRYDGDRLVVTNFEGKEYRYPAGV